MQAYRSTTQNRISIRQIPALLGQLVRQILGPIAQLIIDIVDAIMLPIQRIVGVRGMAYVFVLPNIIVFSTFVLLPMATNFVYTFTGGDKLFLEDRPYVGTQNIERLFDCGNFLHPNTCTEDLFARAVINTAFFFVAQVALMISVSLLTAVVLNGKIRARGFFRSVFFYPVLLSPIVVALIWKWILQENGLLNGILVWLGSEPARFLTKAMWARFWVVVISVWSLMGFYTLILLAGLQSIPGELYEAAEMDGANAWRRFWSITMPLLMPTMLVVVVLSSIRAVQIFDVVFAFTGGGPGSATLYIVQYIYNNGFASPFREYGLASAASLVMAVVLVALTIVQMGLQREDSGKRKKPGKISLAIRSGIATAVTILMLPFRWVKSAFLRSGVLLTMLTSAAKFVLRLFNHPKSRPTLTYTYLLIGTLLMFGPVFWLIMSSFKTEAEVTRFPPRLLPYRQETIQVEGYDDPLPLFDVTLEDGTQQQLVQVRRVGLEAQMIDPKNPEGEIIRVNINDRKPVESINFSLENYRIGINSFNFLRYFTNSVIVTIAATILTLILNSMAAFALSKYEFPGRNAIFGIIISTLMVPLSVILVPAFLLITALGWNNHLIGVIIPTIGTPTGVFLLRQYMLTIPDELIESARIDGATEWRIYLQIILPLSGPALAVLAIFSTMWRWNDFLWPKIVLTQKEVFTLQVGLQSFQGELNIEWHLILAMTVLTLLPITLVFGFLQRYITTGIATTGMK